MSARSASRSIERREQHERANPDRERIRAFLADPGVPLAFNSSPLLVALGTTIVAAGEGRIVLHFEPAPLFLQGASVVQGGAVSAMLDFAMAAAIMTKLDDSMQFCHRQSHRVVSRSGATRYFCGPKARSTGSDAATVLRALSRATATARSWRRRPRCLR